MLSEDVASRKMLVLITQHLPAVYIMVALLVSTALCVLTPPFYVPDESGHARRGIQTGHGQIVAEQTTDGVGGATDVNFLALAVAMDGLQHRFMELHSAEKKLPDGRVTEGDLAPLQRLHWTHRMVFSGFQNTAVYSPVLYLPQAAGWRIGEAADLTIVRSLQLARMFAAWCAIGIGWLALRLCGSGRWLLFVYLLLPTELSLVSSCSQDALLMPLAGLVAVMIWRALEEQRTLRYLEIGLVACLMAVCVIARVPYLPMTLALVLPALEMRGGGWRKLVPGALGMLLVAALTGAWQMTVHRLGTVIAPEARPALQIGFLRAHPLAGARSLLEALFHQIPLSVAKGMYVLGINNAVPPHGVRLMLIVAAAVIVVLNLRAAVQSWAGKTTLVAALLGTVSGIWLAEYIIWTPPGAGRVLGLQTRYFLPLLPFVLMLCPESWAAAVKRWPQRERDAVPLAMLAGAGIFVATVLYAPWTASHVFYRTGLIRALSIALAR